MSGNEAIGRDHYEFVRELGHGATGTVSLVRDHLRGRDVALKRLRCTSPETLLRIKRQFRAIVPLCHPGLVKLYDLEQDALGLFFTMEVVEGQDLKRALNGALAARDRVERAQVALHVAREVLPALRHLHTHRVAHCDVKPANLMLDPTAGVKLLDFGAAAILDDARRGRERRMGTPRYMSPERLRGGPAHPAWDMYALGITLLEMAADRSPFTEALPVFEANAPESSLALSSVEGVDPLLGQLCRGLLCTDPSQRWDAATALAHLSRSGSPFAAAAPSQPESTPLVGRDDVQRWLVSRTVRHSELFNLTIVEGPSGCGKSSLLKWFAAEQRAAGALILQGRGRPEEHLRYNVLDGAVDDLAELLMATPQEPELAADLALASVAFPVLTRERASRRTGNRQQAFDALIRALSSQAALDGLYILIDDLHWADLDSIAFLQRLCEISPNGVGLLATLRTDVGESAAQAWLDGKQGVARRELTRLLNGDVSTIIENTARRLGLEADREAISGLVPRCAGLPLLAEVAGRTIGRSFQGVDSDGDEPRGQLSALLRSVGVFGHELVALLLVADRALPVARLQALCGQSQERLAAELAGLERLGLVRLSGAETSSGDAALYHDLVRTAAYGVLDAAVIQRAHELHAGWLQTCSPPEPLRLVRHLLAAQRLQAAAEQALAAAQLADAEYAYGSAADLYGIAIEYLGRDRPALLRARAEALTRTGRHGEAVRCWQDIAATSPDDRSEALLNEAASRLAGNEILEGYLMLEASARDMGLPALRYEKLGALGAWLRFLAGPLFRSARGLGRAPKSQASSLRTLIHLSENMAYFDPLTGLRVMQHACKRAYQLGAAAAAARCEFGLAFIAAYADGRRGPSRLGGRYLRAARACLRHCPDALELQAIDAASIGMDYMRGGDWQSARSALDDALQKLVGSGHAGSWIHLFFLGRRYEAAAYGQDFFDAQRVWRGFEELLRERRDSNLNLQYLFGKCTLNAFTGHLDLRELEELRASWPDEVPTIQKMLIDYYATLPDLNAGSGRLAWRALSQLSTTHWRFQPDRGIYCGMFAAARALAEVNALRSGDPEASERRIKHFAAVARRAPPLLTARATRALAYLADARNQREQAVQALRCARDEAQAVGQQLDVAIASYQLGRRLGGDEGSAYVREAVLTAERIGAHPICLEEDLAWR